MRMMGLVLLIATAIAVGHPSFASPRFPQRNDPDVRVEVDGTLRCGIVAIGGETTGYLIRAGEVVLELDFPEAALQRTAEAHDREMVHVTGTLERRRGVERGDRWIVLVDSLEPIGDGAAEPCASVRMRGTLRTGINAPGGETTGTILRADDVTCELDFDREADLRAVAERLNRRPVSVDGTLTMKEGPERGKRLIIDVESLEPQERERPRFRRLDRRR